MVQYLILSLDLYKQLFPSPSIFDILICWCYFCYLPVSQSSNGFFVQSRFLPLSTFLFAVSIWYICCTIYHPSFIYRKPVCCIFSIFVFPFLSFFSVCLYILSFYFDTIACYKVAKVWDQLKWSLWLHKC